MDMDELLRQPPFERVTGVLSMGAPDDPRAKTKLEKEREYLGVLATAGARYEGIRRFHRDSFLRITCVL